MTAAFGVLIIALVAMAAWIAQLKHNRIAAIALVVLVGVLAGNAPGPVGEWSQAVADWLYDLPTMIAGILNEDGRR